MNKPNDDMGNQLSLKKWSWQRHPDNPVLPPGKPDSYDSHRCMNPFIVKQKDEYWMYYSGGDENMNQRICLAIASVDKSEPFKRMGVVLDIGKQGAFDEYWCVLPSVKKMNGTWYLYYTGRDSSNRSLQSFGGIGLAISNDGVHFERYSDKPIITGNATKEYPDNIGIAGGGSILTETNSVGEEIFKKYYTLAIGKKSDNVFVDQEKVCAVCESRDGIIWTDHRVIMERRSDVTSEDIAVAAPFVWKDGDLYRMVYCGIGSRWGYYSISEAVSSNGYDWYRGRGDENLSLTPSEGDYWDSEMVEYPCILQEENQLRLYYCGNGYGRTGIGMAHAER